MNRSFVLLAIAMVVTACSPQDGEFADSVYVNGRIYTADSDQSWAESLAIRNGEFVAVGTAEDTRPLIGPDTLTIDAQGLMIIPGIHDAHAHMLRAGYRDLFECYLLGKKSLDELTNELTACRAKIDTDHPWLVVHAEELNPVYINGFDKDLLDSLYPDTPVFIRIGSNHVGFFNSKALEAGGIEADPAANDRATVIRDKDGIPTGLVFEDAVGNLKDSFVQYSAEDIDTAARHAQRQSLESGVTSLQIPGISTAKLDSLKRLESAGDLSLYISGHMLWSDNVLGRADPDLFERRAEYHSDLIRLDSVKIWLDGQPIPPWFTHAVLRADGSIDSEHLLIPTDVVFKKVTEWDKSGLRVKMHAAGEGAARLALNAVEHARSENGETGLLHEIGHASLISAADMARMRELSVVAEMSPGYGGIVEAGMPGMDNFWRFGSLADNGVMMTAGSDVPVVPPNPFPWLQNILTRPGEAIGLEDSLDILTINGAKTIARDAEIGSIEVGKVANMAVLDRDLSVVPRQQIAATRVLTTVFKGKVVHSLAP